MWARVSVSLPLRSRDRTRAEVNRCVPASWQIRLCRLWAKYLASKRSLAMGSRARSCRSPAGALVPVRCTYILHEMPRDNAFKVAVTSGDPGSQGDPDLDVQRAHQARGDPDQDRQRHHQVRSRCLRCASSCRAVHFAGPSSFHRHRHQSWSTSHQRPCAVNMLEPRCSSPSRHAGSSAPSELGEGRALSVQNDFSLTFFSESGECLGIALQAFMRP